MQKRFFLKKWNFKTLPITSFKFMVQNFHDLFQSLREVQKYLMHLGIRKPSCVIKSYKAYEI